MGVWHLNEAEVEQLLDMPTAIAAVSEALAAMAAGGAHNIPRQRAMATGSVLHTMSAAAEYLGLSGWKAYFTTRHGARFHVALYDHSAGEMVALIQADRLGQIRTGATTGVAVQQLAAADADAVGLFGSGWQAESQLAAVAAVRPLKRAVVYSRNEERRREFAERMQARLGIEIRAVDEPQLAVADLPIVVTATTSARPVFEGAWLSAGTLVCAVGSNWLRKTELDVETLRRAERVVCDSVECCQQEAGDFVAALEQGVFRWDQAENLADVVAEESGRRHDPQAIVIFKSVGMAIEDVATAAKVLESAKLKGVGRELNL